MFIRSPSAKRRRQVVQESDEWEYNRLSTSSLRSVSQTSIESTTTSQMETSASGSHLYRMYMNSNHNNQSSPSSLNDNHSTVSMSNINTSNDESTKTSNGKIFMEHD